MTTTSVSSADEQQAPTGTYLDVLLANLAAHPERDAVVGHGRRISCREARLTVLRMAEVLRERNVGPGDTVAIFARNRPEVLLLMLAAHLAGGRLALIPHEPALGELRAYLTRAGVTAFIFDPAIERAGELAKLAAPPVVLSLGAADQGEDLFALMAGQPGSMTWRPAPEDISTLLYTGGTTGHPKMVLHQHRYQGTLVFAAGRRKAECPVPVRFLICTQVGHTSGYMTALIALLAEGTAVLMDFDAAKTIELLRTERITGLALVPPMLGEVMDHPSFPAAGFPDLIRVFYGGGPTTSTRIRQALERFGPTLRQAYGLTEVAVVTMLEPHEHDPSVPGRLTAVGRPLPGAGQEISLRDEHGEVAPGEIGEVCVRGPLVMKGYWQDPAATAEVIRDGWFHTGDLGRWDDDGYLHLVDRVRDMIITGQTSDNVYCALLEEALEKHPGIRHAAAVGLPDELYGESVNVVCVPEADVTVAPGELRSLAVAELGHLYEPRTVTFAEALPWTALGKIDKKALRAQLLARTSS